jgi:hypothetical protein
LYDRQFELLPCPESAKSILDKVLATIAAIAAAGIGIDTIITKVKGEES